VEIDGQKTAIYRHFLHMSGGWRKSAEGVVVPREGTAKRAGEVAGRLKRDIGTWGGGGGWIGWLPTRGRLPSSF
jgi:hypothetical protein